MTIAERVIYNITQSGLPNAAPVTPEFVLQVRQVLYDKYRKQLCIRSLSGKPLDLAEGEDYVALSLMEEQEKQTTGKEIKKVSRPLPSWHCLYGNNSERPKLKSAQFTHRYGITAPPGGGKSTLLGKMLVDNLSEKPTWAQFDWVMLFRCRDLVRAYQKEHIDEQTTLAELIYHFYLKPLVSINERVYSEEQLKLLAQGITQETDKLLLLIDGLDEYQQTDAFQQLYNTLLSVPHIVISGRPQAMARLLIDKSVAEVNIKGFSPEAIESYIASYFKQNEVSQAALQSAIRRHDIDLVRNPVCLEALCFIVEASPNKVAIEKDMAYLSLSELYEQVVFHLLKRHMVRRKAANAENMTPVIIRQSDYGVFLRTLAIEMLEQSQTSASYAQCKEILEKNCQITDPSQQRDILQSGLLRGNGEGEWYEQDYEFLHRTFQEFLVASQLTIELPLGDSSKISAAVKTYKYNSAYQNVWPFIAGLLTKYKLEDFLALLLAEPRNLIDPDVDMQLILSVLEGASLNEAQWECSSSEFPLLHILQNKIEIWFKAALENQEEGLSSYITLPHSYFSILSHYPRALLSNGRAARLYEAVENRNIGALNLVRNFSVVPEAVIKLLPKLLQDKNSHICEVAIELTTSLLQSPLSIIDALPAWLSHKREDIRTMAISIAKRWPKLLCDIEEGILPKLLIDKNFRVRCEASNLIRELPNFPEKVKSCIITWLESEKLFIRLQALEFAKHADISFEEISSILLTRLKNKDYLECEAILQLMCKFGSELQLSEDMAKLLAELLAGAGEFGKRYVLAEVALAFTESLHELTNKKLIEALKELVNNDSVRAHFKYKALICLSKSTDDSKATFFNALIEKKTEISCEAAALFLDGEAIFQLWQDWVKNSVRIKKMPHYEPFLTQDLINALRGNFPQQIINKLPEILCSKDLNVCEQALYAAQKLAEVSDLSAAILTSLKEAFDNFSDDDHIIYNIMLLAPEFSLSTVTIPLKLIDKAPEWLAENDWDKVTVAMRMLEFFDTSSSKPLQQKIITALESLLANKQRGFMVRNNALCLAKPFGALIECILTGGSVSSIDRLAESLVDMSVLLYAVECSSKKIELFWRSDKLTPRSGSVVVSREQLTPLLAAIKTSKKGGKSKELWYIDNLSNSVNASQAVRDVTGFEAYDLNLIKAPRRF